MMNRRLELLEYGQPMVLTEQEVPTPPPGGLVVKVSYCGVCHSDIHMTEKQMTADFTTPRVFGHEISGEVYAVGDEIAKADPTLTVGTNVLVYPWIHCNNCDYCSHGNQYCPKTMGFGPKESGGTQTIGVMQDGGYQQYVVLPTKNHVVKVEGVAMDTACLTGCSGVTAYNCVVSLKDSVDEAIRVKGRSTVLLVGAGGLSLWAVQFAKATWGDKVKVVVVDIVEEKLADAKEAGADVTATWDPKDPPEAAIGIVRGACQGFADGVIDFTGLTATAERVFYCLHTNATWVIVGIYGGLMPQLPILAITLSGIRIQGVYVGTRDQVTEVLDLLRQGKVKPPPIVSISLEEVNDTFQKLKLGQQKGRAVVKM